MLIHQNKKCKIDQQLRGDIEWMKEILKVINEVTNDVVEQVQVQVQTV